LTPNRQVAGIATQATRGCSTSSASTPRRRS